MSVAVAVLSALERVPVKQYIAMTGSLDVRGDVLPVGGITAKVEAAIEAGMKEVVIPKSNKDDLILDQKDKNKIRVIEAVTISDVLRAAIGGDGNSRILKKIKFKKG